MNSADWPDWLSSVREFSRFATVWLVAIDIDGTLAQPHGREIQENLVTLRNQLRAAGVTVTLATGRAFAGADAIARGFMPRGVSPLVLYNGSVVAHGQGDRIISRASIPGELAADIVELAIAYEATVMVYDCAPSHQSLFREIPPELGLLERVVGWSRSPEPEFDVNGLRIEWQPLSHPVRTSDAVAVLVVAPEDDVAREKLYAELTGVTGVTITRSGAQYFEVRPLGVSKATGVAVLAESLRIPSDEIAAIGDNDNDTEMLRWAGVGIAVGDATVAALRAAKYRSPLAGPSGCIHALRTIVQSRRLFRGSVDRLGLEHKQMLDDLTPP